MKEAEEALKRRDELSVRKGSLEEKARAAEEAGWKLEELRARAAELEAILREGKFAPELRGEREALEESLSRLRFCRKRRDELIREEGRLREWELKLKDLEEARRNLQREEEFVEEMEGKLGEKQRVRDEVRRKVEGLEEVVAEREKVRQEWEEKERELEGASRERDEAWKVKVTLEEELRRIEELRSEKAEKEKELACAQEESQLYRELAEAFGKDGIQAMIIEGVLPEIEDEANKLLTDMTGGRMHVRFRTQKQTQKGEMRETLEIEISDEKGTRDYRLYSGGESFRVDLAIRVALARLLARRAGAPLSVLFVDEGFGTQDSGGLERVVEAINSIRDRFKFILVITHLEDLKERFPVRIEVTKGPSGSAARVVRVW